MNVFSYWIRKLIATCFFLGYCPFAPGTIGAAITIAILFFCKDSLSFMLGPQNAVNFWWAMVTLTAISFFVTDKGREIFGQDDPKQTIFDEVVGQFIVFFMIPINIRTLILGFVLFRFFDIVKPFPIYRFEELEGGIGVTMDDVVAGILANVTLMFSIWVYNTMMSYF